MVPMASRRGQATHIEEALSEIRHVVVVGCSDSGADHRIFVLSPLLGLQPDGIKNIRVTPLEARGAFLWGRRARRNQGAIDGDPQE
jgi:hypothetical protein